MKRLLKYNQRKIRVTVHTYAIPRLFSRLQGHASQATDYYLGGPEHSLLLYEGDEALGADDTSFQFDKWTLHCSTSNLVNTFGEEVFTKGVHILPELDSPYINTLKMELYDEVLEHI